MGKFRTHYDNLQVGRNATSEVIAAAYRTLSLKYHPDRNGGDERCEKIMRILNSSYAVLSDPKERSAHDIWIAVKEMQADQANHQRQPYEAANSKSQSGATFPPKPAHNTAYTSTGFNFIVEKLARFGWLFVVLALVGLWAAFELPEPSASGLPPYQSSPTQSGGAVVGAPAEPAFTRPLTAPNGAAWPAMAGYIDGEPRLRTKGLSTVTVDNDQNSNDVFVKLVAIGVKSTEPVRQFFIPAHGEFEARNLEAGEYDIRYMDLDDGSLARSESFSLKQMEEVGGTRFSNITMTLYKVRNGNMQTYPLLPSEF